MKQLLITGFNPFDERGYNTSAAILEELPPAVGDFHLHKAVLPVEWNEGVRNCCIYVKAYGPMPFWPWA